jgi:beta-lactamase regulating signal transducer with metallopeptidase domain
LMGSNEVLAMPSIVFALLWNVGLATALGIVVWGVCSLRSLQERPAIVHTLWLLVLFKLVTPPLIPVPVLSSDTHTKPFEKSDAQLATATPESSSWPAPLASDSGISKSPAAPNALVLPLSTIAWPWLLAVTSACGTATLIFISVSRFSRVAQVLRRARASDGHFAELAASAAQRLGVGTIPKVLVVDAPIVPFLWSKLSRPVIVLPNKLIESMSDEQIACILSHELAHYARKDHWANLFAFGVTAVFWWNPVAWWAWRNMRAAQEECCDALVIEARPSDRRCYAETLFQALEFVQAVQPICPSVASGFGDRPSLVRRFQMIATLRVKPRVSWTVTVLAMIGIAAMLCIPVHGQQQSEETKDDTKPPAEKKDQAPAAYTVPFSFEASKLKWISGKMLDAHEKIAFGEANHGLQLGVKLLRESAEYRAHEEMKYEMVIRNSGKEPVRFVFWQPQQPAAITDSDGKHVPLVWSQPLFTSLPTFISLAPEEAYRLKYSIDLSPAPENSGRLGPWWESPQPGQYKLGVGIYLDIVPSDATNPEKATQVFPGSAKAPVQILNPQRE